MVRASATWRKAETVVPHGSSTNISQRTLIGGGSEIRMNIPSEFIRTDGPSARSLAGYSGGYGSFAPGRVVQIGLQLAASEVRQPYAQSPYVHSAIEAFAGGFVQLRPKVFDRHPSDPDALELDVPDITRLLETPNPAMIQEELLECLATEYKLVGDVHWFILGAKGPINARGNQWTETPVQIIPASKALVDMKVDEATGMPLAYRYRTGAKGADGEAGYSEEFPAASVIAFRSYNPHNMLRGVGAVEASAHEIQLYHQATRFMQASVESGGQSGGIIVYPERLQDWELDSRQEILNDELGGEHGLRFKMLDNGAKFYPNPVTPKDMEWGGLLRWLRETILSVLGVPGVVVGASEQSTYNNVESGYLEMWRGPNGVLRLGSKASNVLTMRMLRRMQVLDPRMGKAHMVLDSSHVERLRKDRTDQIKAACEISALRIGVSANASLAAMGVDVTIEGGDEILEDAAPVVDEVGAEEPAEEPKSEKEEKAAAAPQTRAEVSIPRAPLAPIDSAPQEALRAGALAWMNDYVAAQKAHWRKIAAAEPRMARLTEVRSLDQITDPQLLTEAEWHALLLDDVEWIERMTLATGAPLEEIYTQALAAAQGQIPGSPILTTSHPRVFQEITNHAIQLSEGSTSTAARAVRKALLEALANPGGDPVEGLSMRERIKAALPELDERTEKLFGSNDARAATIAQTEAGRGEMAAKYAQWAESGVTEIEWISSQDPNVRLSHQALDGERIPLGATFTNGLRYPLDHRGSAGEVINCRCGAIPTKRLQPDDQ